MPAVVTFDPINLWIEEVNTGLDVNETDLFEIYSEWKDWLLADPGVRLGYPQAFRQVGSDPITELQNLGATLFLGGGWKFKPAEYDHQWQIAGNVFTDPAGLRRTVPTTGAYTVEVTFFVSNLVDAAVARLDLTQLLQAVYIDTINGTAGTTEGIGTPTKPVLGIDDAFTIAARDNLNTFVIHGSVTLDRDVSNAKFVGSVDGASDTVVLGSNVLVHCAFEGLNLLGDMTGHIHAQSCNLQLLSGLDGVFRDCGFAADFTLEAGSNCVFANCFSGLNGLIDPVCTFQANSVVVFRNYSGGLSLSGLSSGNIASVDLDPGSLTVLAGCTGGTISVRGTGYYDNQCTNLDTLIVQGLPVQTAAVSSGQLGGVGGGGGGTSNELATFIVASGATSQIVPTDATQVDNYFDRMLALVETVGGEKAARRVKSYSQTNGVFTLEAALPFTPTANDSFTVIGIPRDDPVVVGSGS